MRNPKINVNENEEQGQVSHGASAQHAAEEAPVVVHRPQYIDEGGEGDGGGVEDEVNGRTSSEEELRILLKWRILMEKRGQEATTWSGLNEQVLAQPVRGWKRSRRLRLRWKE